MYGGEPLTSGVSGVPVMPWVCVSSVWRTDVRQAGLWRWELTACRAGHRHRYSVSYMDLLLRRAHPDTKSAEQVTTTPLKAYATLFWELMIVT